MEEKEIEYVWLETLASPVIRPWTLGDLFVVSCDRLIGLDCTGFAVLLRLVAA